MYQLHDLIKKISQNPHEYLGEKTLSSLQKELLKHIGENRAEAETFNLFCKNFYGENTLDDGFKIILKHNSCDEARAFEEFFHIYERYFCEPKQIDSRGILHKFLYLSLIEIRSLSTVNETDKIFQISNLIHNLPLKMLHKKNLAEYDDILDGLVEHALPNAYLSRLILGNFPELNDGFWELWRGENSITLTNKSNLYTVDSKEVKIKEFFSVSAYKAQKIANEQL